MNYVLTVYHAGGVQEIFLPGVQNRAVTLELKPEIIGCNAVALSLDVFNDVWTIRPNENVLFNAPSTLIDGLRIDAHLAPTGEQIAIFAETLNLDSTRYVKFRVNHDVHITVGSGSHNMICYNDKKFVTESHMVIEPSPAGAVLADYSRNGTYVNGIRVEGRQTLHYGDTIYIVGLKMIWLDDTLAVNHPKVGCQIKGLTPVEAEVAGEDEPSVADEYYSRSPRRVPNVNSEDIEIDKPPDPAQKRKQPLWMTIGPSLTMILPIGMGILFTSYAMQRQGGALSPFMFMGIITSVTAAVVGVFWALSNLRMQKRQEKEEEERRQKRYSEYLDRMERIISEKQARNRTALCGVYSHTNECMRWVLTQDRNLWGRNVNHVDFLMVRLGMGAIPSPNQIIVPKSRFSLVDDELAERPFDIKSKCEMLTDVPICLSLLEHKLIGITGSNREIVLDMARVFVAQIALLHSYTDVKMVFIVPAKEDWGFARWLPHVWDNDIRLIANDANSVGEVLYHLSDVIRTRSDEDRQKEHNLPHYVVFFADPNLVENEAAYKSITAVGQSIGFTALLFYDRLDRLPNHCTVIVQRDRDYSGYYSLDNAFPDVDGVIFDDVPVSYLDEVARNVSGIKVREAEGSGTIPQMLTFLDMYKTSDVAGIDIYRNWLENRTYESMKALIGARGGGTPVYLDVHEKYHGPHGLVAGTTGAGKSEMLQTYILSLAVTYHPYEVSFILIDYKGGGMAESFKGLTHVAGIITNLGGNQTNRALASIKSEIKRRQAVFNEYKIKHIDSYIELFRAGKAGDPMPHLLIIADEFAELKKEQPEFVRELVSASRVGRSLGVHLILATQKPDGVVDDQIWSNTKFRVCLRVAEKADSMGMLKHPEAAYITQAGRGYFQVGNDEIFEEFQSGWSGARYEPDVPFTDEKGAEVTMINLWGRRSVLNVKAKKSSDSEEKVIQLDAVTEYISQIAAQNGIAAISNVWLPPLPRQIYLDELQAPKLDERELSTYVGLIDDPVNQVQRPVPVNFTQNNHVIVCSSISGGKTTFLQTVLYGLVTTKTPKQLHIYIADYASRTLGVFAALPHVGGVVYDDDQDRTNKLISMLMKELQQRKLYFASRGIGSFKDYSKLYDDVPAIVFAVDNISAFLENNPHQYEDNMIQLSREAASYGIYLFISGTNYNDVRGKLRQNIRFGVGLQLPEKYDYNEIVGVRNDITAEEGCPGRGMIKVEDEKEPRSLEFQTALCMKTEDATLLNAALKEKFEQIAAEWTGDVATPIPQVPQDLTFASFQRYRETEKSIAEGLLPIGYDLHEASLFAVKPSELFCYAISGDVRSGKTNAIRLLAIESAVCDNDVYIIDAPDGQLSTLAEEHNIAHMKTADQIFEWLSETIIPEFKRRNGLIKNAGGRKFAAQAMQDEKQIIVIIHDFGSFLNTVYSDERQMFGFLEAMVKSGNGHKIAVFAAISKDDSVMHSSKATYTGFVSWKQGIHLGGQTDSQRIFDFDMPPTERMKKLPPGQGHTIQGVKTVNIVMPEV